jgi:hypothetical protein
MNQLKIEIGDTVRIAEDSKYYKNGVHNPTCEGVTIAPLGCSSWPYRVRWLNGEENAYKLQDLTLVKKGKTMQFTKSDLIKLAQSNIVFVKYRDESYRVLINGVFNGVGWAVLDDFYNDLKCKNVRHLDVVAVYTSNPVTPLVYQLEGQNLTLIWERTEQTEAQKEMEVLQEQAKALQEQAQAIQEQITKLQGTL